jgi:hypothetical protein
MPVHICGVRPSGGLTHMDNYFTSVPLFSDPRKLGIGAAGTNVFRDNSLDPQVLRELTDILHAVNPYVKLYKTAGEVLSEEHEQPVALRLRILDSAMRDPRTYNTPTADEVGILIVGLGEEEYRPRDIVFYHRNPNAPYRGLQHINELAREYLPLRCQGVSKGIHGSKEKECGFGVEYLESKSGGI